MMPFNAFAQRFGVPEMQPGGPIQMPAGAAPAGQLPAPAPVNTVQPQPVMQMPNAFANHVLAPPAGGGYGVRNMMPNPMPAPGAGGFRMGSPDPFNALRMRMGIQSL